MNREYQKFGKANRDRAMMLLRQGDDLLPESCRCLWEVYENFLDGMNIRDATNNTIRNRNKLFETYLRGRSLDQKYIESLFDLSEVAALAELQPRIFHEESFQTHGTKSTDQHNAFASDFQRIKTGRQPKEPLERLLNLLYIVRCNLDHGQKVLPEDWAEIRKRNLTIFQLVVPIQRVLSDLLFSTIWADGVFAYGTLKSDLEPAEHIRTLVNSVDQDFYISGKLYDFGAFPGLVLGDGGKIPGLVLRSSTLHTLLRRLDEIEGSRFARQLIWASTDIPNVAPILVWIYEFTGDTSGAKRCTDGRWPTLVD